jgi:hypothetical protein
MELVFLFLAKFSHHHDKKKSVVQLKQMFSFGKNGLKQFFGGEGGDKEFLPICEIENGSSTSRIFLD